MDDVTRLKPQEVHQRMQRGENVQFVDSRNPDAWGKTATKLPGAVRIPADEAEKHLAGLARDRLVVTYCT